MNALITFFGLTFVFTWSCYVAAAALPHGAAAPVVSALRSAVVLLGVFAPGLVALALTSRARGAAGVRALVEGIVQWRVPARWYLFAISYVVVLELAAAQVHRAVTGSWPRSPQSRT